MKRFLLVLSVAMLLAAVALPVLAEPSTMESNRLVSIGVGGGVAVPVSDAKDAFKNGFNGQGFARLNLKQLPIVPRLDFSFSKFDVKSAKLATPGASGTGQLFSGLASLQYFLMPGPIRPYVIAGLGAYNVKTDMSGIPGGGTSTDTRFGINGGGGVMVKLGSLLNAYVEGHIDNVFKNKDTLVSTNQLQVLPVTVGIVY